MSDTTLVICGFRLEEGHPTDLHRAGSKRGVGPPCSDADSAWAVELAAQRLGFLASEALRRAGFKTDRFPARLAAPPPTLPCLLQAAACHTPVHLARLPNGHWFSLRVSRSHVALPADKISSSSCHCCVLAGSSPSDPVCPRSAGLGGGLPAWGAVSGAVRLPAYVLLVLLRPQPRGQI